MPFLTGCTTIKVPAEFVYKEVETRNFTLASWQKVTNPAAPYKIYIEGDGYAFNARGKATQDQTPRGTLVRELAFGDDSQNVIYFARPYQYIKSPICSKRHWTTARFALEVINAEYEAIKNIADNNPVNCGFKTIQNAKSNHLYNFLLCIGIVFDIALGGGKGGMSGQHADII